MEQVITDRFASASIITETHLYVRAQVELGDEGYVIKHARTGEVLFDATSQRTGVSGNAKQHTYADGTVVSEMCTCQGTRTTVMPR